jgi:hypothetical protein
MAVGFVLAADEDFARLRLPGTPGGCGVGAAICATPAIGQPLLSNAVMALERQLRCQRCGARGKASLDVELRPRD